MVTGLRLAHVPRRTSPCKTVVDSTISLLDSRLDNRSTRQPNRTKPSGHKPVISTKGQVMQTTCPFTLGETVGKNTSEPHFPQDGG